MVERDRQLATLNKLMTAAIAGHGRIAAVRGAVGTGKTALLRVVARSARERGALVLEASASRLEQALSLGVLGQLFDSAALPSGLSEEVGKLLDGGAAMSLANATGTPVAEELTARNLHDLCRALLTITAERPLVILIDDAHDADPLSIRCLSYVATRIEHAPVLLVYSEAEVPACSPVFPADVTDRPCWHRIDLAPLSIKGTRRLLTELASDPPPGAGAAAHRLTGGNPALLRALAEDRRLVAEAAPAIDTAVRSFLTRLSPGERAVTRGLAVLGADAPPGLLGRLVDLDSDTVAVASRTLAAAGILVDGWFRDPVLATTTLAELPLAERFSLRVTAATLLREVNAAPVALARQLVAAADLRGRVPSWAVLVLTLAASQAQQAGDLPFAVRCLQTALDAAEGDAERAACRLALAQAQWRTDPMLAMRHLPELTDAILTDLLDIRRALAPINWLVWFGNVDQAVALMAHVRRAGGRNSADLQGMRTTRLWLAWLFPTHARRDWQEPDEQDSAALTLDPMLHAARLFTEALAVGADDRLVAEVEKILHGGEAHARTFQMVVALIALVYGERLDVAAAWCDMLMHNAESKGASTQRAIFTAVRAEIAARQGDMPLAEQCAASAFELVPPSSWGVAVGFPLATLLRACTAMGRYREAAEYLQVPVPGAMFQSVIGVHYLRARSLYFQSTGRHPAALSDSRSCGELLARWEMEAPAFTPWRSDAAVSCLWLGRPAEARELAEAQLALTGPGQLRTRGISLRALAATLPLEDQPALLEEAAAALRACGDRLEVAQVLVDLDAVCRRLGRDPAGAAREAAKLSAACGVPTPPPTMPDQALDAVRVPGQSGKPERTADPVIPDNLSEAERRVAGLAATGCTNRQIAHQLFVTVSTVEQHLTKAYRKLRVSRRTQLRAALSRTPWTSAPPGEGTDGQPTHRSSRRS